jgi:hypothetical protein
MKEIENFIGIFPNAANKEYCEKIIHRFEYIQKSQGSGRRRIITRQESEKSSLIHKDNDTYFIGGFPGDYLPLDYEDDLVLMDQDAALLEEFSEIIWNCYDKYTNKYGILSTICLHKISPAVRIQKYKPGQGYHVWHCDTDGINTSRRILVVTLYLNTIEEGGETEFLHQNMRVSPVEGTMVLWPPGWTHPHRGNPTLKGTKYIITTWLEFIDTGHPIGGTFYGDKQSEFSGKNPRQNHKEN